MKHNKIFTLGRSIALISAVVLALSAFFTWGSNDYASVNGLVGDGMITVTIGILAFLLLYIHRVTIWISLIIGLIGLGIGIIDFYAMYIAAHSIDGTVGIGLYAVVLGSSGIVVGTIIEIVEERSKKLRDRLVYLDDE